MAWPQFFRKNTISELDDLLKAANPDDVPENRDTTPDDDKPEIGRKAILTDPFFAQQSQQTLYKYKISRLSNKTLKDVSLRDWLISAIIQNRCDTLIRFARPQIRKFDMGYRIVKITENEDYTDEERQEIENLQAFIYNCGRMEGTPDDDKMLFGEFIKLIVRDALTFGHVAIEKVKTRGGALHRFRPLPAENLYLINKNQSRKLLEDTIKQAKVWSEPKSDNDPIGAYTVNEPDIDFYKYVQMSGDNRALAVFGDEDMIFRLFNPQNFADSNGYAYSPLELAIINITNHMNTEQYNSNFFTHGQAAKGVLHLKGTVTQSQLTAFRRQFYNLINGSQNAWRTPIIAGLDDVQWVPMAGGSKEMEYLNYNMHLMRAICTQFQIDPVELGLDLLVTGGKAFASKDGNMAKVEFSRERGLYPLLMYVEDVINRDILPAIDSAYGQKYKFQFEGYTDETPQTEVALLQAEMTVNKTMNDLLSSARKDKIKHPVGDLNMNQAFWALVEKNMTKGEIRETFFEDKDASKKKELQYIPGDPMFLQWQTLLFQMDQQKKMAEQQNEQMQAQQQQQDQQSQLEQGQHGREQEKHQAEMSQLKGQAAYNASQHGKQPTHPHSTKDLVGKNLKNPLD
jgi:hypothetical protein